MERKVISVALLGRQYGVYLHNTGKPHWELTPGPGAVFTTEDELNEALAGIKSRYAFLPAENFNIKTLPKV